MLSTTINVGAHTESRVSSTQGCMEGTRGCDGTAGETWSRHKTERQGACMSTLVRTDVQCSIIINTPTIEIECQVHHFKMTPKGVYNTTSKVARATHLKFSWQHLSTPNAGMLCLYRILDSICVCLKGVELLCGLA